MANPLANALEQQFKKVTNALYTGAGAGSLHLASTQGADPMSSAWVAVGATGASLIFGGLVDQLAPTIGQVGAAWQFALETKYDDWSSELGAQRQPILGNETAVIQFNYDGKDQDEPVRSAQFYDLPADEGQLRSVANYILQHPGRLSEADLPRSTAVGIKRWRRLRDVLVDQGHLSWVNPHAHQQGVELTRGGRAFFQHILRTSNPLLPHRSR